MLIYNMHRERKFLMTITNLAALFLELFESPSYKEKTPDSFQGNFDG